jgi:hypothetical protein
MPYAAVAAAWIATAAVVAFAIHITGSAVPLWAMLLPACIEVRRGK